MARYQSGSFQLHTTDLNGGLALNIGGVTDMQIESGTETASDDSGNIYDESRSIVAQVPEITLTFKDVSAILANLSLSGYCIASDGTHPGVRLFARVLNDCKSPPAADANVRYTVAKGLVVLGRISAPRGADATISVMVHPISDGTNAPLAGVYTGVTLPTTFPAQFTLGRCKVGNVTLSDMADMQLDFGVQISAKTPEMGSVWPDSVAVRAVQPVALFTNFAPTVLDDTTGIPWLGKQATHAQTIIQLKKRQNYAAFVDNGADSHIRITMNGHASITTVFSGSGNAEGTTVLRVEGVHDGTNVPVIVDTGSTYTDTP